MDKDYELMRKAIEGDKDAARVYCGSYMLVRNTETGELLRHNEDLEIPPLHNEVLWDGGDVYDKDGFLKPCYWSLPRTYSVGKGSK